MNRRLPFLAILLGLAGLVPFLAAGVLAVGQGGDRATFALVAYGAVILSFLGAVHWGFALQEPSGRGERTRLVLGVIPSLIAWVALLLAIAVNDASALGLLLVGFGGVAVVESRGARQGLMPLGYLKLRYGLTAIVGTVLLFVLLMQVTGLHVQI